MNKLKIWNENTSWNQSEKQWEEGAEAARQKIELKSNKTLPKIVGITEETALNLKWKSLKYMLTHDKERGILKGFLKHPFRYGKNFIKSCLKEKSFVRDGDFYLYGIPDVQIFQQLLLEEKTLFILGFSYCHKPFECPSGRFTDACHHDPEHPVCRQCFIGKAMNALPENDSIPLIIPTIHYIGQKIFEIAHKNPDRKILFIITACEMTLEMFGDWGNMVDIRGIGVRLDGRICNTMRAFELSEEGIKPGLTVVLDETKERILELIRRRREHRSSK